MRQRSLDRVAALKLLLTSRRASPTDLERFSAEGRLTAQLEHPSIVRVYDHGVDDDIPWILYELLEGRTVRALLREGPIPWTKAAAIGLSVARALEFAHPRGAIHRDIKPENIMDVGVGPPRLMDFGMAKWAEGCAVQTSHGMAVGTVEYIAPDSLRGEAVTPSADLYSLGVVLYEMLSGRRPFLGQSTLELLTCHMLTRPVELETIAPDVPPELARLVMRCLEKRPEDRPSDAGALVRSLVRFVPSEDRPFSLLGLGESLLPKLIPAPGRAPLLPLLGVVILAPLLARFLPAPVTPAPDVKEITFPRPGVMRVEVSRQAPAALVIRLELPSRSIQHRLLPAAGETRLDLEELPADSRYVLSVTDDAGEGLVAPRSGRTPGRLALHDTEVWPTDTAVLVYYTLEAEAAAELEIWRRGGERVHRRSLPPSRTAREQFAGLMADQDYLLKISLSPDWGGIDAYPFRTRPATFTREVDRWLEGLAGGLAEDSPSLVLGEGSAAAGFLALLRDSPDPRAAPVLRAHLDRGALDELLPWTAQVVERLHHPGLAASLSLRVGPNHGLETRFWTARALLASGERRGLAFASDLLESRERHQNVRQTAAAAAVWADPTLIPRIAGRLGDVGWPGHDLLDAVRRCDPAGFPVFLQPYLGASWTSDRVRHQVGLAGIALLRMTERVAELRDALLATEDIVRRNRLRTTLVLLESEEARRALLLDHRQRPGDPEVLWALVRSGSREASGEVAAVLAAGSGVAESLHDALLVVALSGDGKLGARVLPFLESGDARLRRASAWAVGRLGLGGQSARLAGIAVAGDEASPAAIWALGNLGARESAAGLRVRLQMLQNAMGDRAEVQRALLAWSLGKLEDREAIPILEEVTKGTGRGRSDERVAATVLAHLQGSLAALPLEVHFPFVDFEPIGSPTRPGEAAELEVFGRWGYRFLAETRWADVHVPLDPGGSIESATRLCLLHHWRFMDLEPRRQVVVASREGQYFLTLSTRIATPGGMAGYNAEGAVFYELRPAPAIDSP